MRSNKKNKRKTVEIYFILYLAALVLLIPDGTKRANFIFNNENNNFLPFELKPEKSSLNLLLMLDTNGIKQLSFDSTNKIYYTGNPDKIEFDFIVEEASYLRTINIKPDEESSDYFKVIHNQPDQYVEFLWSPPKGDQMNRSYNVIVKAEFKSGDKIISKRTEFTLNKNVVNRDKYLFVANNPDSSQLSEQIRNSLINSNIVGIPSGEINLIPTEYNIKTVAFSNWKNIINVTGLNLTKGLLKNPEITVTRTPEDNKGSASIWEIEDKKIILGGKAPEYGSMTVKLELTRDFDNSSASIEFGVLPQPIGTPEFPTVMYPGRKYEFNPNLPILTNQSIASVLRDDSDNIIMDNSMGSRFSFVPNSSHAGKTFYFERYIDGKLFGQKYPILVKDYPKPSFSRVQKINEDKIRVITSSYGLYNSEENFIKSIKIEGNAEYTEIIGQAKFNESDLIYTQVFEFKRKDKNKVFSFTAIAVNRNGVESETLRYP